MVLSVCQRLAAIALILHSLQQDVPASRDTDLARTLSTGDAEDGPPWKQASQALFAQIRTAATQRTTSDMTRALKRFNMNKNLMKEAEQKILKAPVRINFSVRNFQSDSWHNIGGMVSKDKLREDATKNADDEGLSDMLAANRADRGIYYEQRLKAEDATFGSALTDGKLPPEERPVYGALDLPGIDDAVGQYGELYLLLKPSVLEHATLTAGDSHDLSYRAPGASVHYATTDNLHPLFADDSKTADSKDPAFVEVQIWRNGLDQNVRFDKDVEKMVLPHQGVRSLAMNADNPIAYPEARRAAFSRLFGNMASFAKQYGIKFVDEHDIEWKEDKFVDELEAQRSTASKAVSELVKQTGFGMNGYMFESIFGKPGESRKGAQEQS